MQPRNKEDFWAGVMYIALGLGFAWKATSYQMGTAARMGPGYFPFWLGVLLAILGAIILLTSLSKKAEETRVSAFDWRIIVLVIGSVVLYGAALSFLGIYVCTFLLVMVSSLAGHDFHWQTAAITGLVLVVFTWLAFIKGLGLIFPLWPSFLGLN